MDNSHTGEPAGELASAPTAKRRTRSTYLPAYAGQAEKIARLGATDEEIADFFGTTRSSLKRWKKRHPEFRAALEAGKLGADLNVSESLYRQATGYHITETKVVVVKGEATPVTYEKEILPDARACIFWLRNRRPDQWREKHIISAEPSALPESLSSAQEATLRRIARIRAEAEKDFSADGAGIHQA